MKVTIFERTSATDIEIEDGWKDVSVFIHQEFISVHYSKRVEFVKVAD